MFSCCDLGACMLFLVFELCAEVGKQPQKPFSGNFNVRIPPETHQRIATRAARDGVSLNKWVTKALEQAAGRP